MDPTPRHPPEWPRPFSMALGLKAIAGAPGFEPGMADPKSAALPLGDAPIVPVRPKYRVASLHRNKEGAGASRLVHETPWQSQCGIDAVMQSIIGMSLTALEIFTRLIVGLVRQPPMRPMVRFSTTGSGGGLLRNPYPAFADASRHGLQFRMHGQLRQDVLHMGPDRVGRHLQVFRHRLVVVSQR
jgi:hypothetical protein